MDFHIEVAGPEHFPYAEAISQLIEEAARARGTGIAKRTPAYIRSKMAEGKAIIALFGDELAGFCYIETWSHGKYAANSGLIVAPSFRNHGLAKRIKRRAFELSREKYPEAKLFGITTSLAVMKINAELGYKPVTFSELTTDEEFWQGCQSCPNYDILTRTQRKMCLCTGMLYDPEKEEKKVEEDSPLRRQLRNKLVAYRVMQERLGAYLAAVNRHDVEQALSYVRDDFRLVYVPDAISLDREQLRDLLQWQAGVRGRVLHEELEIGDEEISGILVEQDDFLSLLGLEALRGCVTFRFGPNGYVREQVHEPLPGQPSLREAMQPAVAWAAAFYPEELAAIFPGGRIAYSGESARRWMALLHAWREATRVDV